MAEFEVVYASALPGRLEAPITVELLAERPLILPEARWGEQDPTRRQLAERAQRAGLACTRGSRSSTPVPRSSSPPAASATRS